GKEGPTGAHLGEKKSAELDTRGRATLGGPADNACCVGSGMPRGLIHDHVLTYQHTQAYISGCAPPCLLHLRGSRLWVEGLEGGARDARGGEHPPGCRGVPG